VVSPVVHRVVFAAGMGALIALIGAGLIHSRRADGRLPSLAFDYGAFVQTELKAGRGAELMVQLALASAIDFENRARLLPALAWVARREGRLEVEREALLRLIRVLPGDADAHARLAEMALDGSGGADADALAEAQRHADRALQANPDSIAALVVSGRIARARGDTKLAFDTWNRAGAVDPAAAQRALASIFNRDPELGYDFLVYRLNLEGS
jgi:tetratricopeptide (TPR) repeat protein